MTHEQEQLEERLRLMEESMTRMSGVVEDLVQNQSQPPLLTDAEQADVLRARLQAERLAEREKAAAEVAAEDTTVADPEEDSSDGSKAETHNPRSRRNTKMRKPAAHTEGVRPPVV